MSVDSKKTRLSGELVQSLRNMPEVPCQVPSERLHDLMPSLTPLLRREPLAVLGPDGARYFLLDQAQFETWRMGSARPISPAATAGQADLTVSAAADRLMESEHRRVRSGDLAEASWHIMRNRLDRHILPAMGHLAITRVDRQAIEALMTRLFDEQASATTQSQYLVIVRKMLKLAHQERWIETVPELPRVRVNHKPRSALTLPQYRAVLRVAKTLSARRSEAPVFKTGDGQRARFWVTPRYRTLPPDMYALMVFMVNSFVRPSDIKNLKHRHIEPVRGAHTYLRLTLPESKRHDKPIVSLQPAVRIYEWLCRQRPTAPQADDWVFLPQEKDREHALGLFNFWLKWVLREAGLGLSDAHGQARTLYCLRHTAITFRLLYGEGIDMLTLARNARTSVDMIEKFYASTLTGEMNVGMLQSRRAQKKPRDRPGAQSTVNEGGGDNHDDQQLKLLLSN